MAASRSLRYLLTPWFVLAAGRPTGPASARVAARPSDRAVLMDRRRIGIETGPTTTWLMGGAARCSRARHVANEIS
jgi:hypothetical protein